MERRGRLESSIPTGEEAAGGRWVDACRARHRASELGQVTSRIQEHVRERVPHFARRAEDVKVIAVREDGAAAAEDAVHGSCEARTDRFHARSEIPLTRRLDNRVQVIVLDRILDEAKAPAVARSPEAAFQLSHEFHRAQRRQPPVHLQSDMTREPRRERAAEPVRMPRARAALAARTRTSSSPAHLLAQIERELSNLLRHREQGDIPM
jgi:hypothetical protein